VWLGFGGGTGRCDDDDDDGEDWEEGWRGGVLLVEDMVVLLCVGGWVGRESVLRGWCV
jgi:hypothetical protein